MTHEDVQGLQQFEPGELDADVIVVGYGPVGQAVAAALGEAGHRVIVCERRRGRYESPRAGHFDHEIMRMFQALGVAEEVDRIAEPAKRYEFLDSEGEVVSRLPRDWDAPSGWEASYHFYQPELEEVLDSAIRRIPTIDVRFGANVVSMRAEPGHVVVGLEDGQQLSARYLIGADGANSAVRRFATIPTEDLGFEADWLVIDVRRREGAQPIDIPDTGQILNPARPSHMARIADRYYRWEFMVVDGDDPVDLQRPERIWQLIEPWISPDRGELVRQTVYTFRSIVATSFRSGSVLLAGDAAHLMPPFLGQGMCSGIRDAATLGWMLDLVLRGVSDPQLLDLYTESRRPHVLAYIDESVQIGRTVCETDPAKVEARIEEMRTALELPPPFQPPVGAGFRQGDPLAGELAVQPVIRMRDGTIGRSDDVLGRGFTLIGLDELEPASIVLVESLRRAVGLFVMNLADGSVQEEGSVLREWLAAASVTAVLVRPDFYVFGSAQDSEQVTDLLGDVSSLLELR